MTHGSERRRARKRGGGVPGENEMCEEGERDWENGEIKKRERKK